MSETLSRPGGRPLPLEVRITTGPWDLLFQMAADVTLELLRARIRRREAERTDAQARQADARVERAAAADAALRERSAQAEFARSWLAEEHSASLRVWEQLRLSAEKLRQDASPFRLPDQDICSMAGAATRGGDLPALIVAPFYDRAGGQVGEEVSRQVWWRAQQLDWTAGMAGLSGHMRPLSGLDLDVDLIGSVLGPVPFVLIHGDTELDRVQIQVLGSGVLPGPAVSHGAAPGQLRGPAVSICGTLPWPESPGGRRLAQDMVDTVLAWAGALGEVFHLARSSRLPRLHERVPEWLRPGVTAMIIGGYGVAVENAWEPEVIRGLQDLVASMPDDDGGGLRQRAENLLKAAWSAVPRRWADA